MKSRAFVILFFISALLFSCETEQAKQQRLQREEQKRIEREITLENERKEKEMFEMYGNNSLYNGATPYEACFGSNNFCSGNYCSQIQVTTPSSSDVLVTIKRNGDVVSHAYISAASSYTFDLPNGTYQPFFYYGKGWYPDKEMPNSSGCELRGGFVSNEIFGKDEPQTLNNNVLSYELILQQNGNFSTRPSNAGEAF